MNVMTDIHCHILANVDDGARSVEHMKKMLDIAYEDGIRRICFTPHFKIYEFEGDEDIIAYNLQIKKSFSIALEYISLNYPDMSLHIGNEILYHHDVHESLESKKCSYLNDTSYILMEFVPGASFFDIKSAVTSILRKGIIPVIAHIERYSAICDNPTLIKELKEYGALIQVNAASITNFKFGKTARFIKTIFKKSYVDVVATDAHSVSHHKPVMSEAYAIIEKKYGEKMAKKVFYTIPNMILENERIY